MKSLALVLLTQLLAACGSFTGATDPGASCHDQLGNPTPADVSRSVVNEDGTLGFQTIDGPRPYVDCDLRCRDPEQHMDHWTECGCTRSCICFDAARLWNLPEARRRDHRSRPRGGKLRP